MAYISNNTWLAKGSPCCEKLNNLIISSYRIVVAISLLMYVSVASTLRSSDALFLGGPTMLQTYLGLQNPAYVFPQGYIIIR